MQKKKGFISSAPEPGNAPVPHGRLRAPGGFGPPQETGDHQPAALRVTASRSLVGVAAPVGRAGLRDAEERQRRVQDLAQSRHSRTGVGRIKLFSASLTPRQFSLFVTAKRF